jgi:ribosomal-protein-alanine N-acetyltransferase
VSAARLPFDAGLRPMREADLDGVMRVENRGYPHPWSRGTMRDCLHAGYSAWVMEQDGELVAHAVLSFGPGEVHLLNLCVDPQVQSKGLGRQLLRAMMRMAKLRNVEQMLLEVRPSNTAAVALYNSEGFNEIGRRPRYYPAADGAREDAIVMAIELSITSL